MSIADTGRTGTSAPGATTVIAEWAGSLTASDLPPEVLHHGRRILLDYLAAAAAGSTTSLSQRLREYFRLAEPGHAATAISGPRLTASAAAFVNGSAAHGLELDDGYTPGSVHPGAAVIPAVLAVAESMGASIDDVVPAIIAGVEVTTRIAEAGHPHVSRAGFHNTPVAGVFGATAGVGSLLGLDAQGMTRAMGLAGSHAGGLAEYHADASEVKRLHAGKAARDGVTCAGLARQGVSGPSTVLEGEKGYFAAFARSEWNANALLDGLGSTWKSLRTYVKPYPCCRHLHGAIDASLALRTTPGLELSDIAGVRVGTFELAARLNRPRPDTVMEAQFSLPFAVAAALKYGAIGLETFEREQMEDAEVQELSTRVSVEVDAAAQSSYPSDRAAQVTITTHSGREFSQRVSQPLGEPDNPLSDAEIESKFRKLALPVLGSQRVDAALEQCWRGSDLTAVTSALGEQR